ncbi:unnamed protein product, partial [Polarella glacialis]
ADRHLEIVGRAENREDAIVAEQRAEGVRAWLLESGVPSERMSVRAEPSAGDSSARRVELRLLDTSGADVDLRQRAEQAMSRLFGPKVDKEADAPEPPTQQPEASEASRDQQGAPEVSMEEIAVETGVGSRRRGLRLVFAKPGLAASDASLEIGEKAVRLGSLSGQWAELEVVLPFAVEAPSEPSAKFSRRAGTLTVTLLSAT